MYIYIYIDIDTSLSMYGFLLCFSLTTSILICMRTSTAGVSYRDSTFGPGPYLSSWSLSGCTMKKIFVTAGLGAWFSGSVEVVILQRLTGVGCLNLAKLCRFPYLKRVCSPEASGADALSGVQRLGSSESKSQSPGLSLSFDAAPTLTLKSKYFM